MMILLLSAREHAYIFLNTPIVEVLYGFVDVGNGTNVSWLKNRD